MNQPGETWRDRLAPGERVLWEGAPSDRLYVHTEMDFILIPFGLFVTGVSLLALYDVLFGSQLLLLALITPLCLALGLGVIFGRHFADQAIRKTMLYVLTDQRAIIKKTAFGHNFREMQIRPNTNIAFLKGLESTITFDLVPWKFRSVWNHAQPKGINLFISGFVGMNLAEGGYGEFAFREIPNGDHVHELIQQIKRGQT